MLQLVSDKPQELNNSETYDFHSLPGSYLADPNSENSELLFPFLLIGKHCISQKDVYNKVLQLYESSINPESPVINLQSRLNDSLFPLLGDFEDEEHLDLQDYIHDLLKKDTDDDYFRQHGILQSPHPNLFVRYVVLPQVVAEDLKDSRTNKTNRKQLDNLLSSEHIVYENQGELFNFRLLLDSEGNFTKQIKSKARNAIKNFGVRNSDFLTINLFKGQLYNKKQLIDSFESTFNYVSVRNNTDSISDFSETTISNFAIVYLGELIADVRDRFEYFDN